MMIDKNLDRRNLVDEYKGKSVDSIALDMKARAFTFHVAIENLQHDLNIGSIVRTANAFNAGGVHIVGRRHWNKRGAMATEKYMELYHHSTSDELKQWALTNDYKVVAIDNINGAMDLNEFIFPDKCILLFGQEGPGLSTEMLESSDHLVMIRQHGSTRSINVAAAAAIVIHEWVRRNHNKVLTKTN